MLPLTWIDDDDPLPPTHSAMGPGSDAPGLLAVGGNLSPDRLEDAYRHGVFPWFSLGQPVLWWSPDPRMVLPVAQFRLSRSLRKTIQKFLVLANILFESTRWALKAENTRCKADQKISRVSI